MSNGLFWTSAWNFAFQARSVIFVAVLFRLLAFLEYPSLHLPGSYDDDKAVAT